jgi:D-arabinose 1-dehydrogenase-like Zn-dependent alcohol dehydrogenase
MASVMGGLGIDGQLLIVGVATEPLPLNTAPMIGARQSVRAWPSGVAADSEDTMRFSALTGVRAQIEPMPLERAAEGYERMMSNAARFRVVLTM